MHWNAVIVGQGLAGSVLAWKLRDRGWSVLLLDRGDRISGSGTEDVQQVVPSRALATTGVASVTRKAGRISR